MAKAGLAVRGPRGLRVPAVAAGEGGADRRTVGARGVAIALRSITQMTFSSMEPVLQCNVSLLWSIAFFVHIYDMGNTWCDGAFFEQAGPARIATHAYVCA